MPEFLLRLSLAKANVSTPSRIGETPAGRRTPASIEATEAQPKSARISRRSRIGAASALIVMAVGQDHAIGCQHGDEIPQTRTRPPALDQGRPVCYELCSFELFTGEKPWR